MKVRSLSKLVIFLSIIFSLTVSVLAQTENFEERLKQDPENPALLLEAGRIYYEGAYEGSDAKENFKKAEQVFKKLLELDSKNAVALVYYGSMLTMKARDVSAPQDKLDYVSQGISRMDKAVMFAPDNPEVRLIRGTNSVHLPDMFQRLSYAMKDFRHIEAMQKQHPMDLPVTFWGSYHLAYGVALHKKADVKGARAHLSKVLEVAPDSPSAAQAKSILEQLEGIPDGE